MNAELVYLFVYDTNARLPQDKVKDILKRPEDFSKYEYKAPSPEEVPTFSIPLIFNLRGGELNIGGTALKAKVQVAIYEPGAISIRIRLPIENADMKALLGATFSKEAKEFVMTLLQKSKASIEGSISKIIPIKLSESNETYRFYYIHGESAEVLKASRKQVAGLLVDEKDADNLDDKYVGEVLANSISYNSKDAFFVGWEASVMIDTLDLYDYELIITEIANIQLLKLRLYRQRANEMLGSTSDTMSRLMGMGIMRRMLSGEATKLNHMLSAFYDNAMETLNATDNIAFGLGEWYLSKLYALFANVFKIGELSQLVKKDMEIIEKRQEFVVEHLRARQTDILEFIVIVLIVVEVVIEVAFLQRL